MDIYTFMKMTEFNTNQTPIDFSFVSTKTFDNFITGNNGAMITSLQLFAKSKDPNIISIFGKKSSGKTHLCKATEKLSDKGTTYIDEKNMEFIEIEDNVPSILIIDNVDLLLENYKTEEKIFTLVNEFILKNKKILVTSTSAFKKLKFQIPDLLSRLSSGLTFKINELDDLSKIKVLKKFASERGLFLSPLVCDYIITHFKRDLYYLCNSIKYLDQKSLSLKKKITIPFIKQIIDLKSN